MGRLFLNTLALLTSFAALVDISSASEATKSCETIDIRSVTTLEMNPSEYRYNDGPQIEKTPTELNHDSQITKQRKIELVAMGPALSVLESGEVTYEVSCTQRGFAMTVNLGENG
jgi:hypothetical protein